MPRSKSLAVARYLARQQRRESELFYVEDWRIAEVTVLYAQRNVPQPFESAFLQLTGQTHANALRYWARAEASLRGELARDTWQKPPQPEFVAAEKKRIA